MTRTIKDLQIIVNGRNCQLTSYTEEIAPE